MDAMNSEFYPPRKNTQRPTSAKAQWRPATQKETVTFQDRWKVSSSYRLPRAITNKLFDHNFWMALIIPGQSCRQDGQRKLANSLLLIYVLSWFLAIYFWGQTASILFQIALIIAHTYSLIYLLKEPTRYWNRNERIGVMIVCSLLISLFIYGPLLRYLGQSVIQTYQINGQNRIARSVAADFQPSLGQWVIVHHDNFLAQGVAMTKRNDTLQLIAGPGQFVEITSFGYSIDHGPLIPMKLPQLREPIVIEIKAYQWFGWSQMFLQNISRIPSPSLSQTLVQLCIIQNSEISAIPVENWFQKQLPISIHTNPIP